MEANGFFWCGRGGSKPPLPPACHLQERIPPVEWAVENCAQAGWYNPAVTSSPAPDDAESWQEFLDKHHPHSHILQTEPWGQLKGSYGWTVRTVRAGQSGAQVLVRRLPLGLKLAYVPKGPVGEWTPDLVESLDDLCRGEGAFALKVEPDELRSADLDREMSDLGFRESPHAVQPQRTIVVDITPEEDEILAAMKQKTRYNIRLSGRKEIQVRPWDDVAGFTRMMDRTADRQDFGTHVPAYYEEAYRRFHSRGGCEILVAEYQGEPLASLMVFARGRRAWYFYGASTPKERSRMPTYALQWAAIRWAKDRGCASYDLWGIPDAGEETLEKQFTERSDGLWGVYRFKRGFGGEVQRFAGAWDRVYNPLYYQAYRLFAERIGE